MEWQENWPRCDLDLTLNLKQTRSILENNSPKQIATAILYDQQTHPLLKVQTCVLLLLHVTNNVFLCGVAKTAASSSRQ